MQSAACTAGMNSSAQSTRVVLDFNKPADSLESNFDQLAPIEPSGLVIDSVNAYGH
jgi:hypothetical protein